MGKSIVHDPQAARRHLGYCPQSNVLFGSLTVEEHLIIYGAIKGIPGGPFSPASYQAAEEAIQVPHQPPAAICLSHCCGCLVGPAILQQVMLLFKKIYGFPQCKIGMERQPCHS